MPVRTIGKKTHRDRYYVGITNRQAQLRRWAIAKQKGLTSGISSDQQRDEFGRYV